MEWLDIKTILGLASQIGFPGVVLIMWWLSDRQHQRTLQHYREDMMKQQHDAETRLSAVRQMYVDNVELVKITQGLASDNREVLLMVCSGMQAMKDSINTNQFCPNVRLKKAAEGQQG